MTTLIPLLLALTLQDAPAPEPARPEPVRSETAREAPIPEKAQAEAEPEASEVFPPAVSIMTRDNGDRVEEYRQNGQLYMVKVTPARGPAYYLMDTDGNGKLNRDDRDPRVAPVHWTIYEWD